MEVTPIIPQLLLHRPLVWEQGLRAPCLRRERTNWVTGTGHGEDLQEGKGDQDESIHWNRLE